MAADVFACALYNDGRYLLEKIYPAVDVLCVALARTPCRLEKSIQDPRGAFRTGNKVDEPEAPDIEDSDRTNGDREYEGGNNKVTPQGRDVEGFFACRERS